MRMTKGPSLLFLILLVSAVFTAFADGQWLFFFLDDTNLDVANIFMFFSFVFPFWVFFFFPFSSYSYSVTYFSNTVSSTVLQLLHSSASIFMWAILFLYYCILGLFLFHRFVHFGFAIYFPLNGFPFFPFSFFRFVTRIFLFDSFLEALLNGLIMQG